MIEALSWFLAVEFLGLVALPPAFLLFRHLPDRGYTLVKPASLVVFSYVLWILGLTHVVPNSQITILVILLVGTVIAAGMMWRLSSRTQSFPQGELAAGAGRRGHIRCLLPAVAGNRLRSASYKPHREADGLRFHERRTAKPVLPSGGPLAGGILHQLLLLRSLYYGVPHPDDRRGLQRGLQPGCRADSGLDRRRRFRPALQPGANSRRQGEDRHGLRAGRRLAGGHGGEPRRLLGVRQAAGVGRRRFLGLGGHQGAGGRRGNGFRDFARPVLVVVPGQQGHRYPGRRREPGLHHHRVSRVQLHTWGPPSSCDRAALRAVGPGAGIEPLPVSGPAGPAVALEQPLARRRLGIVRRVSGLYQHLGPAHGGRPDGRGLAAESLRRLRRRNASGGLGRRQGVLPCDGSGGGPLPALLSRPEQPGLGSAAPAWRRHPSISALLGHGAFHTARCGVGCPAGLGAGAALACRRSDGRLNRGSGVGSGGALGCGGVPVHLVQRRNRGRV